MTKPLSERANPTTTISDARDFAPEPGSYYIYAQSHEPRSRVFSEARASSVCIPVQITSHSFSDLQFTGVGWSGAARLRSAADLADFCSRLGSIVYIDITGLPHHVWAPILKALTQSAPRRLRVTYVEPADYVLSEIPTEGSIFDLSEQIAGVAPLPGFVRLTDPDPDEELWFVALLGFEGTRFAHMLEHIQPPADRIIPIIGVPGFRPEYPFYSYLGNRTPLLSTEAWRRVQYCAANSPFGLFQLLEALARSPRTVLQIGIVGTKPHSLGAVLFALQRSSQVDLIYDYPVRSPKRTVGAARQLIFYISEYLEGFHPNAV